MAPVGVLGGSSILWEDLINYVDEVDLEVYG